MATFTNRSAAGQTSSRGGALFKQQLDPRHIPGQRALRRRAQRAAKRKEWGEPFTAEASPVPTADRSPSNAEPS